MIPSKTPQGAESCSFIGFVEKKLFGIKVSYRPKSPLTLHYSNFETYSDTYIFVLFSYPLFSPLAIALANDKG